MAFWVHVALHTAWGASQSILLLAWSGTIDGDAQSSAWPTGGLQCMEQWSNDSQTAFLFSVSGPAPDPK